MISINDLVVSYDKTRNVIDCLNLSITENTIIITSHIIETLTNLCDYIHFLEEGRIQFIKDKTGFKEFEQEIFASIENKNEKLIDELIGLYSLNNN